jgi:hypothetical protein
MEKRLPNFCDSHLHGKTRCKPVRPTQLLEALGVNELDPTPCERGESLSFVKATSFDKVAH